MNGFLPLIEAFLAFALTMVALTVAVSSILGLFQRALRSRAHGLRQMMVYFYRNKVHPWLEQHAASLTLPEGQTPHPLWSAPAGGRNQFLVDMTLLPTERDPTDEDKAKNRDPRLKEVEGYGWRSLEGAVDGLTEQEFLTRLKASEVGRAIQNLPPSDVETAFTEFKDRFNALGRAASEEFGRNSRRWCTVLGFVLAFAVNVDAFNLLSRYMADPKLAATVLEKQDSLLAGKLPSGTGSATAVVDQLTQKLDKLTETAGAMAKSLDAAGKVAGQTEIQALGVSAAELQSSIVAAKTQVEDVRAAFSEAKSVAVQAGSTIAGLTSTFPIGWSFYPNCIDGSTDGKCVALRQRNATHAPRPASTAPSLVTSAKAAEKPKAGEAAAPSPVSKKTEPEPISGLFDAMHMVATTDTSGFVRWLIGVLVTGAMLGLGTPFWVEVFNNFLRARQLIFSFREAAASPSAPQRTS